MRFCGDQLYNFVTVCCNMKLMVISLAFTILVHFQESHILNGFSKMLCSSTFTLCVDCG